MCYLLIIWGNALNAKTLIEALLLLSSFGGQMRIMYVASQPDDGAELNIGPEIGLFQSELLGRAFPNLEIAFYSDLTVEQFRRTITSFMPEILHISAHSDHGALRLRNSDKAVVEIDAVKLGALLPSNGPPELLILSSCNSTALVRDGDSKKLPICVTFDGRVKSDVANAVILQFYEEILSGSTLGQATDVCSCRLMIEQPEDVKLHVIATADNWQSTVLYRPPSLVARLVQRPVRVTKSGKACPTMIEIGLDGAPSDVSQVIFFTDERGLAIDSDYNQASDFGIESWRASHMCKVVYGPLTLGGCLWSTSPEIKDSDERLYAVAVRGSGSSFTVKSSLAAALEAAVKRGLCRSDLVDSMKDFSNTLRVEARARSIFLDS